MGLRLEIPHGRRDHRDVTAVGVGLGAYLKEGSDFNSMSGVIAAIALILLVGVGIELFVLRPAERQVLRSADSPQLVRSPMPGTAVRMALPSRRCRPPH